MGTTQHGHGGSCGTPWRLWCSRKGVASVIRRSMSVDSQARARDDTSTGAPWFETPMRRQEHTRTTRHALAEYNSTFRACHPNVGRLPVVARPKPYQAGTHSDRNSCTKTLHPGATTLRRHTSGNEVEQGPDARDAGRGSGQSAPKSICQQGLLRRRCGSERLRT
jgi:hypothetical protein